MTDSEFEDKQKRMPQLIAFDLDFTLWPFWIDTHVTPPIRRTAQGSVEDKYGTTIEFYPDVPQILNEIRRFRTFNADTIKIAACSRTHANDLAREALSLITVPPPTSKLAGTDEASRGSRALAEEFFDEMEIYPGSKIKHFKAIHERTNIPYTEMLFFDDETRNREVESLGVTFIWVVDGLDYATFNAGLKEWQKRRAVDDS